MPNYVLVSGSSRGIGRAVATDLSRRGFSIIATGHDEDSLQAVKRELAGSTHHIVVVDLAEENGPEKLAKEVTSIVGNAGLRAFVHCASQTPDPEAEATMQSSDFDTIRGHLELTARSGPLLLKMLKPLLSLPSRSHAILLSSDWTIDGVKGPPLFSAAKAFATTVWRQASSEYLRDGIVLCSIIAGNVASYDLNWTTAKWSVDDNIQDVEVELGNSRISLQDIVSAVQFVLDAPLAAVTQIRMIPLDPDYVP